VLIGNLLTAVVVELTFFYVHRSYPDKGGNKLLRTTTKADTSNAELESNTDFA
jgi:hypothetical protein